MTRQRIAITAPDVTAAGYSGMGLRALGIAGALSHHHDVTVLAAGQPEYLPSDSIDLQIGADAHQRVLDRSDVVITSNALRVRQLVGLRAAIISDLYDPSYFEWLVLPSAEHEARRSWVREQILALRRALKISDAILCANGRQRDLYLGAILAGAPLGRLLSQGESDIERRVLTVPNGVSPAEHPPSREDARARLGFAREDVVFLWGGGVWDWMDAETALNAVLAAHEQDRRVRLAFMGLSRGEESDPHAIRAKELLGRYIGAASSGPIRVNARWVDPRERLDYLAAADAGILGQYDHLETHFSFRTRLVDCLQVGLPVLSMRGDELSERAEEEGWGLISNVGDQAGLTQNILRLAADPQLQKRLRRHSELAASAMTWENNCRPLTESLVGFASPDARRRFSRKMTLLPALSRSLYNRGLGLSAGIRK